MVNEVVYIDNNITIKVKGLIQVNMNKVVIKILQGSVVTHTELRGLTIYPPVVFL